MSKPKSILETKLDEAQQAELADWLLSGMHYGQAMVAVKEKFGVEVKSTSSFSQFWDTVCKPLLLTRRHRMARSSDERAEAARKDPAPFEEATVDALAERAYQLAIAPNVSPKDVKSLFMLLVKHKEENRKDRELELAKDKFQFDAAAACLKALPELKVIAATPGLDDRARIEQVRLKLFGTE